MNDYERIRSDMFDVVRKVCRNNYTVLSAYVPFVPVFTAFETMLDELGTALMAQNRLCTGLAAGKAKSRALLETDALRLSAALTAYAHATGQDELARRATYSRWDLKLASEQKLGGIARQLLGDGTAHVAGLAPYLIDGAWLTAFGVKIDAFLALVGTPAAAIAGRKKATDTVHRLVKETGAWLRQRLDPVMEHFAVANPGVYGSYRGARKIVGATRHSPALKGRVVDAEGNPVSGLKVRIAGTQRKSISSAKGHFMFKRLGAGRYTVVVTEGKKEVARQVVAVPGKEPVEVIVKGEE